MCDCVLVVYGVSWSPSPSEDQASRKSKGSGTDTVDADLECVSKFPPVQFDFPMVTDVSVCVYAHTLCPHNQHLEQLEKHTHTYLQMCTNTHTNIYILIHTHTHTKSSTTHIDTSVCILEG